MKVNPKLEVVIAGRQNNSPRGKEINGGQNKYIGAYGHALGHAKMLGRKAIVRDLLFPAGDPNGKPRIISNNNKQNYHTTDTKNRRKFASFLTNKP